MKGLIIRIVKQMGHDKRTLALMLVAPLLIISLLYLLLGESSYVPKIALAGDIPAPVVSQLKKQNADFIETDVLNSDSLLVDKEVDAVVSIDQQGVHITMLDSGNSKALKITEIFKQALTDIYPSGRIEFTYLYGDSKSTSFNSLGYVLLGVLSFFFIFIISGIFIRQGTGKRHARKADDNPCQALGNRCRLYDGFRHICRGAEHPGDTIYEIRAWNEF